MLFTLEDDQANWDVCIILYSRHRASAHPRRVLVLGGFPLGSEGCGSSWIRGMRILPKPATGGASKVPWTPINSHVFVLRASR